MLNILDGEDPVKFNFRGRLSPGSGAAVNEAAPNATGSPRSETKSTLATNTDLPLFSISAGHRMVPDPGDGWNRLTVESSVTPAPQAPLPWRPVAP